MPWRYGTAVRTARRADLLRLLVPISRAPIIHVLESSIHLYESANAFRIRIVAELNVIPRTAAPITILGYRSDVAVEIKGRASKFRMDIAAERPKFRRHGDSTAILATVDSPEIIVLESRSPPLQGADGPFPFDAAAGAKDAELRLTFRFGDEAVPPVTVPLSLFREKPGLWRLPPEGE